MKKILLFAAALFFAASSYAQEYNWGFGFYGDIQASAENNKNFGLQAKYDADKHSSFQAQVFGRTNFVGIGADYLYSFLNKEKNNFNVFLGAGIEQNFYWSTEGDGILRPEPETDDFGGSAQLGVNYYFKPVQLSVFSGYKVKYYFNKENFEPNYIMIGVRYHLW